MPFLSSRVDWSFDAVKFLSDPRFESEDVFVANETPLLVLWSPSKVCFRDLTSRHQRKVNAAWSSRNRKRRLKRIGRNLEHQSPWGCTFSLTSWRDFLEYEVSWFPTLEPLSNFSFDVQEMVVAQIRAQGVRII